jgi:WD40 repeat protein
MSAQPPEGNPDRQQGGGNDNQAPGQLPGQPPALPPGGHPGELALPPGSGPAALPPGDTPYLLLPAPSATPSFPQTGPAAPQPTSAANPWLESRRWTLLILGASLALLVVCAVPVWGFAFWSVWASHSHEPPSVVARLDPGGQGASEAQWSPDGRYLAEQVTLAGAKAGDPKGSAVALWDVETRQEVRRLAGADGGLAPAWSPDGLWLATSDGTHALLWPTVEVVAPGGNAPPFARLDAPDPNEAITSLAWAKDGLTLAVADEEGLGIWQPVGSDWKQALYFRDGACATVVCGRRLLWSPDGQWLLAAPWHGKDGVSGVGVWDAQTWSEEPLLKAAAPLAWSPDSSLVVVRSGDETKLSAVRAGSWTVAWTLDPNEYLHQSYAVFPEAAGWSPDGRWLVESADGWVNLWRMDTRESIWVWEEQQRSQGVYTATSVAWSPDAQTLAVTTDGLGRVTLYDLSNPAPPVSAP